jgi:hypothetical protein
MKIQLHPQILELEKKFSDEKNQSFSISDNQKLYEYGLLYSEALSEYNYLDDLRKIIKDMKFLEIKKIGEAKTDKLAEAISRTSDEYRQCIEKRKDYEKLKCQLSAKMTYIKGEIQSKNNDAISRAVQQKYSATSGEGQY